MRKISKKKCYEISRDFIRSDNPKHDTIIFNKETNTLRLDYKPFENIYEDKDVCIIDSSFF